MTNTAGPYNLSQTPLILAPDGEATPKDQSPDFYQELDTEFANFAGHVLVQRYDFDTPWPTWEMHPAGDEFVYLLSGDVEFVLRNTAGERRLRVNEPGAYVVVPKGTWHTAFPAKPTSMLFVTPGEGTENRDTPPI